MAHPHGEQLLHIGVDVGGTFTDLIAWDGATLHIVKIPSTPPEFHLAVIDAVNRLAGHAGRRAIVHGSTVATNALLQRRGEPIGFITTEGFVDMLLIRRQNRPRLYDLHVERPKPITAEQNWFTVRERMDAQGNVVQALSDDEVERVIHQIQSQGLKHAAVCLLFSFINPAHERLLGQRLAAAGITVSLSCDVVPEFREYERASTTAINAALRPTVQAYLDSLVSGLPDARPAATQYRAADPIDLRIMHSGGGTLRASDAARLAARLVLSGPAGGVIGAGFVARQEGFSHVITYDMGGTSTDVATIIGNRPQWVTSSTIDGLPIGLPMFEINTIGAGGGSIAYVDAGGALRVGPQSAGAVPGPACYGRGGIEPTVTDANLVLGRIMPDRFLGGAMKLDVDASHRAIERLSRQIGKDVIATALGIIRVVEANMSHAISAVTSRRGRDPRQLTLVSFGGAGGLHACGLADALYIPRVLVPPYCGVLSALGMIVAPPVVDASRTILGLGRATDALLRNVIEELLAHSAAELSNEQTVSVECFADVRFAGQSHELTVPFDQPRIAQIIERFREAYRMTYGIVPDGRSVEVVSLRLRRRGRAVEMTLPRVLPAERLSSSTTTVIDDGGQMVPCLVLARGSLVNEPDAVGPVLIADAEATTHVPCGWSVEARATGSILLTRASHRQAKKFSR